MQVEPIATRVVPRTPGIRPGRLAAAALAFALIAVSFLAGAAPSAGLRTESHRLRSAAISAGTPDTTTVYDLFGSYPNLRRLQKGYFLSGTNKYPPPQSISRSGQASLWFQLQGDGSFKQFATAPYRECHWDLLRWGQGKHGLLVYLATHASCYSNHSEIVFHPGIAYMPKTWVAGHRWLARGVSNTTYYEDEIPVCEGMNTWTSRVLGLAPLADGGRAVHAQTDEIQTLQPLPGAPSSSSCPAGQVTTFDWQENFYVDSALSVRESDGSTSGADGGLVRSVGGNTAATRDQGHPQWDSVFSGWEALPPDDLGAVTSTVTNVANASTGNTIGFTYTAPLAGLKDGIVRIAVPPGWTAPTTSNTAGCTTATAGTVTAGGQTITVSGLTLAANGQTVITYGATSGGSCGAGDGATASSTSGAPVWQAGAQGTAGGALTNLASSPSINVYPAVSSPALGIPATNVSAG